MRMKSNRSNQPRLGLATHSERGFTLLEVILAIAILGIALATLGQATGSSHANARRAADGTELTFVAESVLDELLTGLRPLEAIDRTAIANPQDSSAPAIAMVSVAIENGPFDGLLKLRVRAQPNEENVNRLETVELVRWVVNPSFAQNASSSGGSL